MRTWKELGKYPGQRPKAPIPLTWPGSMESRAFVPPRLPLRVCAVRLAPLCDALDLCVIPEVCECVAIYFFASFKIFFVFNSDDKFKILQLLFCTQKPLHRCYPLSQNFVLSSFSFCDFVATSRVPYADDFPLKVLCENSGPKLAEKLYHTRKCKILKKILGILKLRQLCRRCGVNRLQAGSSWFYDIMYMSERDKQRGQNNEEHRDAARL